MDGFDCRGAFKIVLESLQFQPRAGIPGRQLVWTRADGCAGIALWSKLFISRFGENLGGLSLCYN